MSMLKETQALAKECPYTHDEIARLAKINRHWVEKFRQGVIKDPRISNLEKMHRWLSKKVWMLH